jgi:hypothetical protein
METKKEEIEIENMGQLFKSENQLEDIASSFYGTSYKVAKGLREQGYEIAGHGRIRRENPLTNFIGILKETEPIQKSFLGIKYNKKQKALLVGKLWLNHEGREASEEKEWLLEIYGKKYLPKLKKIVTGFSNNCDVNLRVKLEKNKPLEEKSVFDF